MTFTNNPNDDYYNQQWNLEKVQKGMHTLRKTKPGLTMGVYQHSQVRHFHNIYERYLRIDR